MYLKYSINWALGKGGAAQRSLFSVSVRFQLSINTENHRQKKVIEELFVYVCLYVCHAQMPGVLGTYTQIEITLLT